MELVFQQPPEDLARTGEGPYITVVIRKDHDGYVGTGAKRTPEDSDPSEGKGLALIHICFYNFIPSIFEILHFFCFAPCSDCIFVKVSAAFRL